MRQVDEKGVSNALTAAGFDEWAIGPLGTGEGAGDGAGMARLQSSLRLKGNASALVAADLDDVPGSALFEWPHWDYNPWANGGKMMHGKKGGHRVLQTRRRPRARRGNGNELSRRLPRRNG